MDLIGKTLGDFTIQEKLGSGGHTTVYRARQERIGRDVALKVLSSELTRERPNFLEWSQQEVQAAASLSHPHILTIYDHGPTLRPD